MVVEGWRLFDVIDGGGVYFNGGWPYEAFDCGCIRESMMALHILLL